MHREVRLRDDLAALPDAVTAPAGRSRFPKQQHPRSRDLAALRNAECEEFLAVNQDDRRYRRHHLRGFAVLQLAERSHGQERWLPAAKLSLDGYSKCSVILK